MTTKKSSKKSGGKSSAAKSGSKKSGGRKTGGKKSAAPAKGTAKAGSAKGRSVKAGAKKVAARSAGRATKGVAANRSASARERALIGNCLGLVEAGAIVKGAVVRVGGIPSSAFDVDKKMEEMGVITANQCLIVRDLILDIVHEFPCQLGAGALSIDPSTKARAIRDQVKDNAAKPE